MRRFFVGLAMIAALGTIPCRANGNDRQIAQKIAESLNERKEQGDLRGINIDLQVENGAVYLQGHVASEEQEQIAIDAARHVSGVRKVYNELTISEGKQDAKNNAAASVASKVVVQDDEEFTEDTKATNPGVDSQAVLNRIYLKLSDEKNSGRLKDFDLDVEVEEGVVTIKGSVASADQQKRVLDVVRRVPGVSDVVNSIRVHSKPTKSSDELAQEVIRRLKSKKDKGELKSFRLDVQVEEGIVWLSGHVADEEQRRLVLETTRYVPGVVKVVNDLSIGGSQRAVPVKAVSETRRAPSPPPEVADGPIGTGAPRPIGSAVSEASSGLPYFADQPSVPAPGLAGYEEEGGPAITGPGGKQSIQYVWVPASQMPPRQVGHQSPLAFAPARSANYTEMGGGAGGSGAGGMGSGMAAGMGEGMIDGGMISGTPQPVPMNPAIPAAGIAAARFDHPQLPNYAWPSYAPYPNYGAVTYPKQYSPMAWPYIGPFYPYPQVPLGWRKVTLEWDDGWWHLDFKSRH